MYRRHLAKKLKEALQASRVVNIVGPRQAGKTTLVREFIEGAYYITFDDRHSLVRKPLI